MKAGNKIGTFSDRISHLSDDLLFQILSLVPITDAMKTSLLSKRWKSLWKMMPTLEYDENSGPNIGSFGFGEFCSRSLQLHETPVLKTLNLKLRTPSASIYSLIFQSIRSTLLEMTITNTACYGSYISFPRNLRVFQTLVVLKLKDLTCNDIDDSPVCFRSLKSLHLIRVQCPGRESLARLLSAFPVLEDLSIQIFNSRSGKFTISVPSLQRLSISHVFLPFDHPRVEINTHSLKYLKILDHQGCFKFVEDMPNLAEAHVEVKNSLTEKFLRFLNSLEFLSIDLYASMVMPLADRISHRILHLQLHIYNKVQRNLLLYLLKHSPKLKTLKLSEKHLSHTQEIKDQPCSISDPSSVPECVSFHLETFQWRGYEGTQEEIEVAAYILQNASCLKAASISIYFKGPRGGENDLKMIKELKSMFKASTSCQLVIQLNNFC